MNEIKYLTVRDVLDINIKIYAKSLINKKSRYGANFSDEIEKIEKLIECTPKNKSIIEVAAYYLKNIILLQAFSDGNYRTAIGSVLLFLEINDCAFTNKMTLESANQLRNDMNRACFNVYEYAYHEMDIDVLNDDENQVHLVCLDFIKKKLF